MPKDNCDSRVHLMLVSHADSFGIPFESKGSFIINSFVISPCHQVSAGSIDPWHHSMTLN